MKIAVIGYGNIGKACIDAVLAADDMELVGVVRRSAAGTDIPGVRVADDVSKLERPDSVILAVPSRSVADEAEKYLAMGFNTVDSFDIHSEIFALRARLDSAAKAGGATAVISAGWDPGSDSMLRAIMEFCAPKGVTYTNFGPGMSMGHTVAAKAIPGVADALSVTMPVGAGIHRRLVYLRLAGGFGIEQVSQSIKADPYFSHDETHVVAVDDVDVLKDMGHGVNMTRKGVSGATHNQNFTFDMRINNPALTAQVMVAAARAGGRQKPAAYCLLEMPLIDFLPGGREGIIRRLV